MLHWFRARADHHHRGARAAPQYLRQRIRGVPLSDLPPWDTLLGWMAEGQQRAEDADAGLDDARLREPSRLAGWSRGHVLSHLARNADALVNLLAWARTGVESRMYATPGDREEGINAGPTVTWPSSSPTSPRPVRASFARPRPFPKRAARSPS
jgi:Mycothiol maleylpyruvate isomerase N-terminal domain